MFYEVTQVSGMNGGKHLPGKGRFLVHPYFYYYFFFFKRREVFIKILKIILSFKKIKLFAYVLVFFLIYI